MIVKDGMEVFRNLKPDPVLISMAVTPLKGRGPERYIFKRRNVRKAGLEPGTVKRGKIRD